MEQVRPKNPNAKTTILPKHEGGVSFPVNKTALQVIDLLKVEAYRKLFRF